ncbi:MAG: phospho-N-acetylmuramoyl-pentapeptide-transferase [Clostridia bacterium]|nr:phospho-N-acetylmuramoyl-pentapeptide-transferase [Clostridia bacterium]
MKYGIYFALTLVLTFAITAIILRYLIPKLKSLKVGQKILDIGPRWHKNKEGTPTMGGLSFLIAMTLMILTVGIYASITSSGHWAKQFFFTYGMALFFAAIGIWDDSLKIRKKENEGFKAWQKFSLQVVIAVLYLVLMNKFCGFNSVMYIPYFNIDIDLGIWYYIISAFVIVGIVNSVNLNDGIDGLCSSVTIVVGAFFAIASFMSDVLPAALISAMVIGGCAGFLVYNFYPARIFMGDTGSLFLGGLVSGLAFLIGNPLIILVVGFVYVLESLSDIIQVASYKLTHKRVFKMAPIHHHFEQCGWSEIKICAVFSLITVIAGVAAYFGLR